MKFLSCFVLLLTSCAVPMQSHEAQNPFVQSDLRDDDLASDFQSLATDPRFLSYQLIRVQRGEIEDNQIYDIPFKVPANREILLVSACGLGCTSSVLNLYDSSENIISNTTYIDDRAYIALNVGTSSVHLRLDLSLQSCIYETCSAYWALYAK